MSIHLSPDAHARVSQFLAGKDVAGFRLGVKRTGCSGWGYVVDVAQTLNEDDTSFEQDGVRIVVDAASLALVEGTQVDFVRRGLNHEFVFRNPNAAAECGCGESFTTVDI